MPLYEYICHETGEVIELIRPMAHADDPVEDPERKGRVFMRKLSAFSAKSGAPAQGGASLPQACCPCGKNAGACHRN